MPPPLSHYHSFLLRIWRDDEQTPWRVQLEDPHTGERRGFTSIEQMVTYLDKHLEAPVPLPIPAEDPPHDEVTLTTTPLLSEK
ncbi:MAG: hypothetical protein Fur0022_44560 [Anaerolineales bacterium]